MQEHIELEVAIELITSKIAELMIKMDSEKDLKEEYEKLMLEKEKICKGDKDAVQNILAEYRRSV